MTPMTGGVFVKAKRAQSVDDDESWKEGGVSPTLNAFDNAGESRATVLAVEITHALTAAASKGATEDGTGRGVPLTVQTFAFQPDDRAGEAPGALRAVSTDVAPSLTSTDLAKKTDRGLRILEPDNNLGVRRLTPLECCRLMGWPDFHTKYGADGKEIADSAQYKMCGNGIASPVAKYVAECIEAIL